MTRVVGYDLELKKATGGKRQNIHVKTRPAIVEIVMHYLLAKKAKEIAVVRCNDDRVLGIYSLNGDGGLVYVKK